MSTTGIRALFDTNIYISYLLPSREGSTVERILQAAFDQVFTLLMAQEIGDEFSRTIAGKRYLAQRISKEAAEELIQSILEVAEIIPTIPVDPVAPSKLPIVSLDVKDDYLLAHAVMGQADYLVSGDADLLSLREMVEDIEIVAPSEFLAILRQGRMT